MRYAKALWQRVSAVAQTLHKAGVERPDIGKHGGSPSKPPRELAERTGKTAALKTTVDRSHPGTAGQVRGVFGHDLTDQDVVV